MCNVLTVGKNGNLFLFSTLTALLIQNTICFYKTLKNSQVLLQTELRAMIANKLTAERKKAIAWIETKDVDLLDSRAVIESTIFELWTFILSSEFIFTCSLVSMFPCFHVYLSAKFPSNVGYIKKSALAVVMA